LEVDGTSNAPLGQTQTVKSNEVTTHFKTEAIEETAAGPEHEIEIPPALFEVSAPEEYSSLLRYFQKPFQLGEGVFTSGDTATTMPTWVLPYRMLNNDMYLSKFRGYLGFRATMVLTINFNAERFQQGRYMLCAIPCGGTYWDAKTEEHCNAHYAALVTRTQLPRVEFDLNSETSATLRLPYNSAFDYYSFNDLMTLGENGRIWYYLRLAPYSPLDSVSAPLTAKWALFAHFEDVELIGQNFADLQPQSAFTTTTKKKKGISDSQKEAEAAKVGPISGVTTKIAKAAKILEVVPFIGTYMSPLGWAANIATSVAQVFGWSKPVDMSHSTRVRPTALAYATNVDGVDNSMVLAGYSTNEVARFPGMSPTIKDEMSLSYIAGIPAYCKQFLYARSFATDTLVASFEASPYTKVGACTPQQAVNGSGITVTYYTPAEFVASQFLYWRGTICFKFKFVKTEFHAGRISITFNPYSLSVPSDAVVNADAPYVYRDIINIGDYLEYTFKVPYVQEIPYKLANMAKPYQERSFGRVEVRVVDPLVCPDTVSTNVTVLVESYMDEDSEFAVPNTLLCLPEDIATIYPTSLGPQSAIGGSKECKASIVPSTVCIGERILSFRSLIKRSQPWMRHNEAYTPPEGDGYLAPFSYSKLLLNGSVSTAYYADNYALCAQMFLYSRGGVRFKAGNDWSTTSMTLLSDVSKTLFSIEADSTLAGWYPRIVGQAKLRGPYYNNGASVNFSPVEVQVPQYLPYRARVNFRHSISTGYPMTTDDTENCDSIIWYAARRDTATAPSPIVDHTTFYRSAADDADFSYFISIPPMYVGTELPIVTI
jgi:hypothetical protein